MAGCLCNGAVAAYLDFTDDNVVMSLMSSPVAGGYAGSIDGVAFTLTSTDGVNLNSDPSYDGSSSIGCQPVGPLACDWDGVGVENDEVTGAFENYSGQTLVLEFATEVYISSFDFLDLYLNPNDRDAEQASVSIDGAAPIVGDAVGSSGDGGYLNLLALGGPILGRVIEFTAASGSEFWDDHNNDYALAGVAVSAVPVPAAAWLFGSALIGLIGFSKRRKTA